jgi:hypothetical protein
MDSCEFYLNKDVLGRVLPAFVADCRWKAIDNRFMSMRVINRIASVCKLWACAAKGLVSRAQAYRNEIQYYEGNSQTIVCRDREQIMQVFVPWAKTNY